MRMIAGLEMPTAGEIYIAGERVDQDVPPRARGIAMVFQSYALYPHKTAYRNIAFPREAMGMPPPTLKERVHGGARMFGIERLLARFPRQLSGGERQRVALARAGVRGPEGFLFDEPLSNPDGQPRAGGRALRTKGVPAAARHDNHLRDARPGGGDGPGRPHRRDEQGQGAADWKSAGRV